MGILAILAVLEASRRVSGFSLPLLAVLCLLYCCYGHYMSSIFHSRQFTFSRIIRLFYLGSEGIFQLTLTASVHIFQIFLFGSILEEMGLRGFINDISLACSGGDPAKAAILSGGMMGGFCGDGAVTAKAIGMSSMPQMKNTGVNPDFAGAVVSASSAGGQLMPPLMGVSGFIIAEIIGVSSFDVHKVALVFALIFYTIALILVHLTTLNSKRTRVPNVLQLFARKGIILLPIAVYFGHLLTGYSYWRAALLGLSSVFVISFLSKETRLTPIQWYYAILNGAKRASGVICVCAALGIVIGTFIMTGLGLKCSVLINNLSRNNFFLLLFFTMCLSLFLGAVHLSALSNFVLTSLIAAPVLMNLGNSAIMAYMYILCFSIASDIMFSQTIKVSADMAGANPMKTRIVALRFAFAALIIPYTYIFEVFK
jgi:TRAP transporter 4TM/12TM fusion protein